MKLRCFHSLVRLRCRIELADLPQLQFVQLGKHAFCRCHSVVFESRVICLTDNLDLPQLHSIELDYCALRGDERDEQKALKEKPYNYKNTLRMKSGCNASGVMTDLPSLISLNSYRCNCQFIGSVTVESTDSWSVSCRCFSVVMAWDSYRR